MMKALIFGAGVAAGYVLGARAGRGSYEELKATAQKYWQDPRVQDKVQEAAEVVKDKAPAVQSQVTGAVKEAAHKASETVSSVLHREGGSKDDAAASQDRALEDVTASDWVAETGGTAAGTEGWPDPNSSGPKH